MGNNCLELIRATLSRGSSATIATPVTALKHGDVYKVRYCVKWSDATGEERLLVQIGVAGGTPGPVVYPVLRRDGEPLTIGKIRRRELLLLKFINPTSSVLQPHFVCLNNLCPQQIITQTTG